MLKFEVPNFDIWKVFAGNIVRDIKQNNKPSVRKAVANVAADLARSAPPAVTEKSGANGSARKIGEKSLASDIYKCFSPVQKLPFAQLVKSKNWSAVVDYNFKFDKPSLVKAYASRNFDTIYEAFTRGKGSTQFSARQVAYSTVVQPAWWSKQRSTKTGRTPSNPAVMFVKNAASIKQLVNKVKPAVGKMVAGWTSIAKALGFKGAFSWSGNQKIKGTFSEKTNGTAGHEITINNPVGNFNNWMGRNKSTVEGIIKLRMDEYRSEMNRSVNKSITKNANQTIPTKPVKGKP